MNVFVVFALVSLALATAFDFVGTNLTLLVVNTKQDERRVRIQSDYLRQATFQTAHEMQGSIMQQSVDSGSTELYWRTLVFFLSSATIADMGKIRADYAKNAHDECLGQGRSMYWLAEFGKLTPSCERFNLRYFAIAHLECYNSYVCHLEGIKYE